MKFLQRLLLVAGLFCLGFATPAAKASLLMDDVNGSATPGFFIFFDANGTDANIGWMYNASTAYNLNRVETTFRAVPNFSAFTRTVTMSIWDANPSFGGTLLRSGSFNVGNGGGIQGISFADLALSAGQNYFIGLQNIRGLGINIVEPIGGNFGNGQPVGTEFLDGWYSGVGSSFSNFVPRETGNPAVPNNPFAAPILRFYGTSVGPAVPEPSSATMFIACLGICAFVRRKRKIE